MSRIKIKELTLTEKHGVIRLPYMFLRENKSRNGKIQVEIFQEDQNTLLIIAKNSNGNPSKKSVAVN